MTARLGKLIRLLVSDKPGEVVAAAGAINRALRPPASTFTGLPMWSSAARSFQGRRRHRRDDNAADDWRAMRRFCADHDATAERARARIYQSTSNAGVAGSRPSNTTGSRQSISGCRTCKELRRFGGKRRRGAHRRNTGCERRNIMTDEFPETDLDTPTEHDVDEAYGSPDFLAWWISATKKSAPKFCGCG